MNEILKKFAGLLQEGIQGETHEEISLPALSGEIPPKITENIFQKITGGNSLDFLDESLREILWDISAEPAIGIPRGIPEKRLLE